MNQRNAKLMERYTSHPMRSEIERALSAAEKFADRSAAIRANRDLSDEGRGKELKAQMRAALRDIRDCAEPVAEMKSRLKGIVDSIKPASFDRRDLAGALLRQELRTALKGMSLGERAALLLGEKADAVFVDAMLEAPALLSGVDPTMYERAREQRLESLFSRESFEAEDLTRRIEEASAGLQIAKQDVQRASGLLDHEFEALTSEIDKKKSAPWLRRERDSAGNERVVVVPLKGGVAHPATPDEIRDGKFYASFEAYQADRAA